MLELLNRRSQGGQGLSPDSLLKFPGYKPKPGNHVRSGSKSSSASSSHFEDESTNCLIHYAPHEVSPEPEVPNGGVSSDRDTHGDTQGDTRGDTHSDRVNGNIRNLNQLRAQVISTWNCGTDVMDNQDSLDEHNSSDETLEDSGIYIKEGVVSKTHSQTKTNKPDSPRAVSNTHSTTKQGSPQTDAKAQSLREKDMKLKETSSTQKPQENVTIAQANRTSTNNHLSKSNDKDNRKKHVSNTDSSHPKSTSPEPNNKAAKECNLYENLPLPKDPASVSSKHEKETKDKSKMSEQKSTSLNEVIVAN